MRNLNETNSTLHYILEFNIHRYVQKDERLIYITLKLLITYSKLYLDDLRQYGDLINKFVIQILLIWKYLSDVTNILLMKTIICINDKTDFDHKCYTQGGLDILKEVMDSGKG